MPEPVPATHPSPYVSILAWSKTWPDWQRDALRRIICSGPVSADSRKELAVLCRAKHGILPNTGTVPTAIPLDETHTPGSADGNLSVSLSKLSDLQNVGRLLSNQEILFSSSPGLTVIYGENGAGKSGYARVIKKACRARGTPQDIKPDAFATAAVGPAKAKFSFIAGTTEIPFDWQDDVGADPRLSNIFVFDSFSARFHVAEDGPTCFKPSGLDVLPELAKACEAINEQLKVEYKELTDKNTETRNGWKYKAATKAGALISAINANTKPETIDAAAVFTDAEEKRLSEIIAILSTDPKIKAADTSAAAKRIRTFAEIAKSRDASVDNIAMQFLCDTINDAEAAVKAASAAAGLELREGDLPGSGNDVWRKLWEAARAFSVTHAYHGKEFPVAEADAKCVLCQQALQPDAIERYARFNRFVADETRKRADDAIAKIAALKPGVDSLRSISTEAAGIKADLDREAAGKYALVDSFAKAVDARIAHAQKCLNEAKWTDAAPIPASPCTDLFSIADFLDKRAKDELSAADPDKATALAAERDELTDKKWLAGKKDEVKAQIARHAIAAKLKKCQDDCITNAITIKSGELHEAHVTAAFCKAFENELAALGLKTLPVKLDSAKGAKGDRRFGVKLDGAPDVKVSDIASEGEHRCIAIAAFLAELSLASHKSALVLDDPISSLDHKRRDAIATRLVREAESRQVIVFTHDLAFVYDLEFASKRSSLSIHYQHVESMARKPGRVVPGLLWDAQSYKSQMKTLHEQVGNSDRVHREQGETEYRGEAMPVIGRFRGACERIIEQNLINKVVQRHDSKMNVGNAPSIANVTASQWNTVCNIWKTCSNIIEAHAAPLSGPRNMPTPDDMKKWLNELEEVVEAVEKSRKSATPTITIPQSSTAPAPNL